MIYYISIQNSAATMAQNSKQRKSEGLCQRFYNAVSPLRSKNRRIENPPKIILSPQSKPVHITHQPSLTKMIPVEYEPASAHVSAYAQSAGREILIVNGGKKMAKEKPVKYGSFAQARSEKKDNDDDDDGHERKFSDYINKVKNRMMKSYSNVNGGGGGVGNFSRRDSFNDKVVNYINQAKVKIRTTSTNIGH
ncbi:hypothetical protein ABFS83_14G196800 [Erythranthe nasuta]